ncbi:unnamed protein product, partial [Nesidiocoris tenuis]
MDRTKKIQGNSEGTLLANGPLETAGRETTNNIPTEGRRKTQNKSVGNSAALQTASAAR